MRCRRCGQSMVVYEVTDVHCLQCKREVTALIRRDRLTVVRWPIAKDTTPWTPKGAA